MEGRDLVHCYLSPGERVTVAEDRGRRAGLEPGQKRRLASLVSWQAGSVVSRTIIDREAGTVTLFAFDEGSGLSEHTAPFDALLEVVEGEALVTVAGEDNEMEEGDIVILPAGKPHVVKATKRLKALLVMIRR